MSSIDMKELLDAGAHFGHQTRRWNPKMKPYIFGARNGIHIIDLSQTVALIEKAVDFIRKEASKGIEVLMIGTKRQAQEIVEEEAKKIGCHYVSQRWLGGALTNFKTIKASIDRLHDLQTKKADGTFLALSKKENLTIDRQIEKLEKSLGGVKDMTRLPGILIIVDPQKERIALHEAKILGIPVVAIADTNCDPDQIDYLIPSNDDSIRALRLILSKIGEAVEAGKMANQERLRAEAEQAEEFENREKKPVVREAKGSKSTSYVSRPEKAEENLKEFSASSRSSEPEVSE